MNKKTLGYLLVATLISAILLEVRKWYTGGPFYNFLNWNLFLAGFPFGCSLVSYVFSFKKRGWIIALPAAGLWILFLPNAPYILTDLFHLKAKHGVPLWFDLIMLLSYAWTGLMYGFASLSLMEKVSRKYLPKRSSVLLIVALLFLVSFGIYLGRYPRFNSWDIVSKPRYLAFQILDHFIHPFRHWRAWGMTLFMGVFLNLVYWAFKGANPLAND